MTPTPASNASNAAPTVVPVEGGYIVIVAGQPPTFIPTAPAPMQTQSTGSQAWTVISHILAIAGGVAVALFVKNPASKAAITPAADVLVSELEKS